MSPDGTLIAQVDRGISELERFLSKGTTTHNWVDRDRQANIIRVNLATGGTTAGPLCWLCCANVIEPRGVARSFTVCRSCAAIDATAAGFLGLGRLLPVWLLPNRDVSGTIADIGPDQRSDAEDRLAAWFFDSAYARAWARFLTPKLGIRGNIHQTVDVSLNSWQKAVGATRLDSALRYSALLTANFPEFVEEFQVLADHKRLARRGTPK